MSRPLILLSNDDGYHAEGIRALRRNLRSTADVVVVAPDRQQSASSHALTLHRPLRVVRHEEAVYSVDGTPTDCITLAVHEILKRRPDLVVSGINEGANLGDDVHYSGTVSAAMEASILGIPSVAISLVVWGDQKPHFQTAAAFAKKFCLNLLKGKIFPRNIFNVNVPNILASQIKGCAFTKLGKRNYGGIIIKKKDPRRKIYYWIGGDERTFKRIPDSDCEAILNHKISITPLQVDLTNYTLLAEMGDWVF